MLTIMECKCTVKLSVKSVNTIMECLVQETAMYTRIYKNRDKKGA